MMPVNFKRLVRARMAITGEGWAEASRAVREAAVERQERELAQRLAREAKPAVEVIIRRRPAP